MEADLLKNDRIGAGFPDGWVAWRPHASHTRYQRIQPLNLGRRAVERSEVHLYAEHPPHQREQPRMVAPVALELDSEPSRIRLAYPYDRELGRLFEQADICSIWAEHIHQVGRQPAEDIDGEVEAVRRSDRDGVTASSRLVYWRGLTRASLSHDFTMPE